MKKYIICDSVTQKEIEVGMTDGAYKKGQFVEDVKRGYMFTVINRKRFYFNSMYLAS